MPTVYVCHHDGLRANPLDISDAERFGALRTVFGREIFPDEADVVVPQSIERATNILRDFDPDADFLLLIGSPLHIAICSAIVGANHPRFKVLRYDRVNRGYYPIDLDIDGALPSATPARQPVAGFSR